MEKSWPKNEESRQYWTPKLLFGRCARTHKILAVKSTFIRNCHMPIHFSADILRVRKPGSKTSGLQYLLDHFLSIFHQLSAFSSLFYLFKRSEEIAVAFSIFKK